jgi:hypothetical protein
MSVCMRLALPAVILTIAFSTLGRAEDADGTGLSGAALQAKIDYCKT